MALSHPFMHWNEFASLRGSRRHRSLVNSMSFSTLEYAQVLTCSRLLRSVHKLFSVSEHVVLHTTRDFCALRPHRYPLPMIHIPPLICDRFIEVVPVNLILTSCPDRCSLPIEENEYWADSLSSGQVIWVAQA